jgi:hypothetical protein
VSQWPTVPNHHFKHTQHLEFFLGDGSPRPRKRWFMYVHITPLTMIPADFRSALHSGAARRHALGCHQAIFDPPSTVIHFYQPISVCPFPIQCDVNYVPNTFCGALAAVWPHIAGAATRFRAHFCPSSVVVSLTPLCPLALNFTWTHLWPRKTMQMLVAPVKSHPSPRTTLNSVL